MASLKFPLVPQRNTMTRTSVKTSSIAAALALCLEHDSQDGHSLVEHAMRHDRAGESSGE